MRHTHSLILAAALTFAPAGFADDDSRHKEDFRQTFQQAPGGRLEIASFNGGIEVVGWDQGTVEVTGVKYAREASDLSLVRVEITQSGNTVIARAIREGKCNNCGARFVVRVPRRTDLSRLKSSNGAVKVEGIDGIVDVGTSNGGIDVTNIAGDTTIRTSNGGVRVNGVRGALEVQTSNGGIRGKVGEVGSRPVRLGTSNGAIDMIVEGAGTSEITASSSNGAVIMRLPANANARIEATTSSHESIHTDFDVQVRGTLSKGRLEGSIGNGGPLLRLTTSNGSIRILKQ